MRIFYQEPHGEYLVIETDTHDLYHYTGKSQYEGRASAIDDLPTSICTTSISTEYLKNCAEVERDDVPEEWLKAIGDYEEV